MENLDTFSGSGKDSGSFGYTYLRYLLASYDQLDEYRGDILESSHTYSGWFESFQERNVFVLSTDTIHVNYKPILESTYGTIEQSTTLTYFDLENGGRIAEKYIWLMQDGNSLEDSLQFNQHLVSYYETLPEETQTLCDTAGEKLIQYLQNASQTE